MLAADFPSPLNGFVEPVAALPNVIPEVAPDVAPPNKVEADADSDEVAALSEPNDRAGCEVGAEAAGVDPNKLLPWPVLAPNTLLACCPVLVGGVFTGVVDCPKLNMDLLGAGVLAPGALDCCPKIEDPPDGEAFPKKLGVLVPELCAPDAAEPSAGFNPKVHCALAPPKIPDDCCPPDVAGVPEVDDD